MTLPARSAPTAVDRPIHPFLFAAYAVLALLAANVQEIPLQDTVRSFIVALVMAGLLTAACWLLLRHTNRAAILATLVVVVFFSYGHIRAVLQAPAVAGLGLWRHRVLTAGSLLVIGIGILAMVRTRRRLDQATRILNLVGLTALVMASLPILSFARLAVIRGMDPWRGAPETVRLDPPPASTLPDIYYIILDGYARSDYMLAEFGFDNSEFINFLNDRGFFVAERSRPNHVWTSLSLASSLNMEFAQNLGLPLVPGSYPGVFVEPIRHNRVRQALEGIGYRTVALSSGYTPTEIVDADYYFAVRGVNVDTQRGPARSTFTINRFEDQLLHTTPLVAVDRLLEPIRDTLEDWVPQRGAYPADVLRSIILAEFDNLGRVATLPGPKFVFAHIVAPHSPYLFHADGTPRQEENAFTLVEPGIETSALRTEYRDQAIFVTRRIEEVIDAILEGSESTPIIVLQSDHGSGAGPAWRGVNAPGLEQRTSILNAYLVPDKCRGSLYPSITPVNSFRVILNCVYGASLPLLPDNTYYSPWPREADYEFVLVAGPGLAP